MRRRRRGGCLTFLIILAVFAGLLYSWNFTIDVEEIHVFKDNLPSGFDGFRIAVVSDLHAAVFGKDNEKLYSALLDSSPDIIALTGDVTDSPGQVDGVIETVYELVKIAPVYYVTGNHEWENGEVQKLFSRLPETGTRVMRNEVLPLELGGDTIYLVGLEDPNGPYDMDRPADVMGRLPKDVFSVTLVHRNTMIEEVAVLKTDVILCGHGHGGLIGLPGTDGLIGHNKNLFPKHTNGLYEVGTTSAIVSRGIGNNTGIPRIANKPHIPILVLRQKL